MPKRMQCTAAGTQPTHGATATPVDNYTGMNVYLTFDIEIWCNDWAELDQRFPASFERYVYGRSKQGDFALPATLQMLQRHGLRGVFFVEPLFSARFGRQYLETIVSMIRSAGQDVQLHLHPEWTDEIRPALLADVSRKRQHLIHYSLDEQTALIRFAKHTLEAAGAPPVTAFRAGSYAANQASYLALQRNSILIDSSLNEIDAASGTDIPNPASYLTRREIEGVTSYPVTVFRDGLGRLRPAQVGACSFAEMRAALLAAEAGGCQHFVIVSHNFEMLKPASSEPDRVVVRRFEQLCGFLAAHSQRFTVGSFAVAPPAGASPVQRESRPRVGAWATAVRLAEQAWRRLA